MYSIFLIILSIPVAILAALVFDAFAATLGLKISKGNISTDPLTFGSNTKKLRYLILGDSTAAGVGADYKQGIAILTSQHISENYLVEMNNYSVSGARVKDILDDQIKRSQNIIPDLVLISIGGNDVTHFSKLEEVKNNFDKVIQNLQSRNLYIKIVITGSPDVGTAFRVMQPLRFVYGIQSKRINKIFESFIEKYHLTLASIYGGTRKAFKNNSELFSEDKFHPNEKGYKIWVDVLNKGIDKALSNNP